MSPAATRLTTRKRRTGGGGGGGGGGGALSFVGQTSWPRPTPATPAAALAAGWTLRPITTLAQLRSEITGIQNHYYVYYNGTNPLVSSTSSSSPILNISGVNLSVMAAIDLGCSVNMWDSSKVTNGYMGFGSTNTGQMSCVNIGNCSNLAIYGGDFSCDHGYGIEMDGPCDNVTMWDQYIHHVGGSGFWPRDYVSGTVTHIRNCSFRMEVNRFCMDPSKDSHTDLGTGHHGMLLHGNTGDTAGNVFACYAHDPLRPGEVSFGTPWSEGSGGSCMEIGNNATGQNAYSNNTYYALGVNLLMRPDGSNPGSSSTQAGGNVWQAWGSAPLNNNIIAWAEGNNCTGGVVHGTPAGNWDNVNVAIVCQHGRHHNCNQFTGTSSQSGENGVPYNLNHGIVYQDNQAY